jgi:hypothetical protein
VVNNYVVNKSIDVHVVERAAGHPIAVVRAASVIRHPNLVTRVDVGQRVQVRMRAIAPRGMGVANSAPPPPAGVVAKLSARVSPRNGQAPTHLFTKTTVTAPEVQTRFHGPAVRGPAGGPGAMTGPNGERTRNENQPGGPGAMTGPNGERTRNENQPGGPGAMTGPNGERMRNENQPGGPGAMTGPNGERPRGETQQPAGGAAGPQGPRPQSPAANSQPPNPNGTPAENQKKKKKEPEPNPPQ